MIKKLPLPATGVMLGMAALGNLLQSYSEGVRLLCGAVSLILGILIVVKILLYPGQFADDMKNPIMASVFGTFSMAVMLLAGYAKPFLGSSAMVIWYAGIGIHIVLMIYFTVRFMLNLNMQQVFASYYIVYVGIAVASVTAPAFDSLAIGTVTFWFGFVAALMLLVLVTYRYVGFQQIPEPAQPLFCIYTAPVSLCLAGYVQSVQPKSLGLVLFMLILSYVIYIVVLIKTPAYLKMKFYPSYAAFTFPFVITAIGHKMAMACLGKMGRPLPVLNYAVPVETAIAAGLTIYALARYCMAVAGKGK